MDTKRIVKYIRDIDVDILKTDIKRKLRLFCWDSGLGSALNAMPNYIGQQLVLRFPQQKSRIPLNYTQIGYDIYAYVPAADFSFCAENLLKNSSVEVWMKDGWFSASANLLGEQEIPEKIRADIDCKDLHLMRIQRYAAVTGSDGPGRISWMWAALSGVFMIAWIKEKRKKK